MDSIYNKINNRLNKINVFKRISFLVLILFVFILIFPQVNADWVITTKGGAGVLILDENGYSEWTQNIMIEKQSEVITFEDDLNIKFLSFAFIVIGLWLVAVIGFNYKEFLQKRN